MSQSGLSHFGLISSAYAQATTGAAQSPSALDMLQNFAPIIMIVLVFYFLMIRPQQQRAKQLKDQLSQLRRGDTVVTAGGIIGTVARVVTDDEVALDIAEGVRVRVVRSTITGITARGEPAGGSASAPEGDAKSGKQRKQGGTAS